MNRAAKLLCYSLVMAVTAGTAAAMWDGDTVAHSFYENARRNNKKGISRLLNSGYSINSTDFSGNTALCLALRDDQREAYELLKANGADTRHECTKKFEKKKELTYYGGIVWKPSYIIGGAVIAGGITALALGNSGGGSNGGGEGGSSDTGGEGGGGADSNDIVEWLSPEDFETDEYKKGGFLEQINASSAYARLYGLNDTGRVVGMVNSVTVGILDSGVNSNHEEFENTSVSGLNYDYGPCRNGKTKNCWSYSSGRITLVIDGTGGQSQTYTYLMSEEDYQQWAAGYSEDYDWEEQQGNWLPEEGAPHGTHIAGIIAADKNDKGMHGVAFSNVDIIAGRWDFKSPATPAIIDMVDMGAQVINMSFGVDSSALMNASLVSLPQAQEYLEGMILPAIEKTTENNVILVMSAGNDSYSQPGVLNGLPLLDNYKEKLKNLFITVVATGSDGSLASYSNKCGVAAEYCIAAPGGSGDDYIWSTGSANDDTLIGMRGTSMAAPVVAGSVALLMGAYPYLEPQQIVELIFETANKEGIYADRETYGQGMLDLAEATNPQGYLGTFTGDSVDGYRLNVSSTTVRVPAVFKQALIKNMPEKITAFDKYKRPFDIKFASLVSTTHSGEKKFRNDVYNFSRRLPKQTVVSDGISFGFAPSAYNNNDSGMGFIDMAYQGDKLKTSFFFAENTEYTSDNRADKILFNPYLAMNQAYGVENSFRFAGLNVKFGFMTGENGLYDGDSRYHDYNFDNRAYAFNSEMSYQLAPEFNLTAVSGVLAEDDAVLGMNGRGALSIGDSDTFYTGLMLAWQPDEKWSFGGAYYHGWTDATQASGSMMKTSRLMSNSFALDGHYNINKTDVIGLQLSSPLRIYRGHADFDITTGRDNFSSAVYRENVRTDLKPSAREYKFALYHNREINEKIMFKSEIAVRLNPDHERGAETDYRGMVGLSWAF